MNAMKSGKGRITGIVVAALIATFAMSAAGCQGKEPAAPLPVPIEPTGEMPQ
jgi:hypothetical protein